MIFLKRYIRYVSKYQINFKYYDRPQEYWIKTSVFTHNDNPYLQVQLWYDGKLITSTLGFTLEYKGHYDAAKHILTFHVIAKYSNFSDAFKEVEFRINNTTNFEVTAIITQNSQLNKGYHIFHTINRLKFHTLFNLLKKLYSITRI